MNLTIKHYTDLTTDELWAIYHIRAEVFVVEQTCVYQDIDDHDRQAYHLWLSDDAGMQAYARVFRDDDDPELAHIGRVLSLKRRQGLGTQIVNAAAETAQTKLGADRITLDAQVYAKRLYEKCGFTQVSDEFLEDGIPHVRMEMKIKN